MTEFLRENKLVVLSYLLITLLFLININNSFFWDTIQLGSRHANFYLSTHFKTLLLPKEIDSGHIPAFGMYLAFFWKIFGRSLLVSHLAMFPFILGIVYQTHKLVNYFFKGKYVGIVLILILLDPTLLAQMTLVSPDIFLVFFFLWGLNSIIKNNKFSLLLSVIFLFLTSMRGMMVAFSLLMVDLYCNLVFKVALKQILKQLFARSLIYLPALLIFLIYNYYHYIERGWVGFHSDSPWANSFKSVGLKGVFFNLGVLGWRILDFGRVGFWIVFLVLLLKNKFEFLKDKKTRLLAIIFLIYLMLLPANMIWAKNLLAHRYLIPIYLTFVLLTTKILFDANLKENTKNIIATLLVLITITGNLWVYPDVISQGWDATLGHLPYYKLRKEAINYLEENKIEDVQSFFPNTAIMDDIDLNNKYYKFNNKQSKYIFYSNVFNVSTDDYFRIKNDYLLIKQFRSFPVRIEIYKEK